MSIGNHYINGEKVRGEDFATGAVFNPATGEKITTIPYASSPEVDRALSAATAAYDQWSEKSPLQRSHVLFRFRDLVAKHLDEIAGLVTAEQGKVASDAQGSVQRGLEVVEFACGIPQLLKGEFSESVGTNVDTWSMRQPLGVCVGITPFNFPAMVPLWMFPLAIACGNTFILKPSEKVPSTSVMLAELFSQAGLTDGVFNVVHGDKQAVDALIMDPRTAAVSFVGSTPVAQHVFQTANLHNKRVQALGGAKNHMIVMPDADMDQTANALMGAAYGSAGERCMAISVVVTVGNAAEPLLERLIPKVTNLAVGPGTDPASEMGPLISPEHLQKVKGYIDSGVSEGAKLLVDGRDLSLQGYENGNFIGGSLFDHVTPEMKIYREEIFGPVLSVVRVENYAQALKLVNDHEFGNGTAIFTRDGETARNFSSQAKIGMVGINVPIPVPVAFHSFGGWKQSLFGDHHVHGMEGVRFYTRLKTVTSRWPKGGIENAQFAMPTYA